MNYDCLCIYEKKLFMHPLLLLLICISLFNCNEKSKASSNSQANSVNPVSTPRTNKSKIVHVFVALCDNINQGIVKVPATIGNGQDADHNLYWGAAFGVKSWFKKQTNWKLVSQLKRNGPVLERCVFKHKTENVFLVADAYDGAQIKQCTIDFLKSCSGNFDDFFLSGNDSLYCGGNADLLAYVGHDGLMDFSINEKFENANDKKRSAIILACKSKSFFAPHIKPTGANPLLWSNGLMSPEAYTLSAAINGWINNEHGENIHKQAAIAYNQYQKCGMKGAMNLLATGW